MPLPYSSFWRDVHYESIVEHDPRLRSICTKTPWINFDEIIDADWKAAKNDDGIASHPIAIYLNKLAPKSQQYERKSKELIYKRFTVTAFHHTERNLRGMRACSVITINPRNRWFKLYERNPLFTYNTTSALSTQLYMTIQARRQFLDESVLPVETTISGSLIPSDKYPKCYKVRIYHRQTWNHLKEGGSFPSIWKEPDPSAWIDDVSGVALRHITLLCRDMICECNKCTTGCPVGGGGPRFCEACLMKFFDSMPIISLSAVSGSVAEGCMLPTFLFQHEFNKAIKKWSDIDIMYDAGRQVGFSTEIIERNIFATIETDNNCRPGYFKLRVAGTGEIFRLSDNMEFLANPEELRIRDRLVEQILPSHFETTSTHGPAKTSTTCGHSEIPNLDEVYYFSCSSWPPIAQTWVDRERSSKWPSTEIIRDIVSKGCRIVHKPHRSSRDPDAEFRFSFSEAELILFNTLSVDQKKCFIAFKALVKYGVCRSEFITKKEIDLSSYSLKTIFLWSCETIPADQWQTTNGWARCLLYLIDQLYACLKSRTLPAAISFRNAISWTRSNHPKPFSEKL